MSAKAKQWPFTKKQIVQGECLLGKGFEKCSHQMIQIFENCCFSCLQELYANLISVPFSCHTGTHHKPQTGIRIHLELPCIASESDKRSQASNQALLTRHRSQIQFLPIKKRWQSRKSSLSDALKDHCLSEFCVFQHLSRSLAACLCGGEVFFLLLESI